MVINKRRVNELVHVIDMMRHLKQIFKHAAVKKDFLKNAAGQKKLQCAIISSIHSCICVRADVCVPRGDVWRSKCQSASSAHLWKRGEPAGLGREFRVLRLRSRHQHVLLQ